MSESNTVINNFIQKIIDEDNLSDKWGNRVHTRFPPAVSYTHLRAHET